LLDRAVILTFRWSSAAIDTFFADDVSRLSFLPLHLLMEARPDCGRGLCFTAVHPAFNVFN
jgi:hypothetical protein